MEKNTKTFYDPLLKCPKCKKTVHEQEFISKNCGCGFRLRINFNYELLKEVVTKSLLLKRTFNHDRYMEFFPIRNSSNIIQLGTGGTSLIKSTRISENLGLKNLYFKLENQNPSGSFKDRPISIGVSKAKEFGSKTLSAASSGNAAAALATFGAKAKQNVVVFVPEIASLGKLAQITLLGAKVIRVKNLHEGVDSSISLFKEAYHTMGWTPCPSFGPFNPFQFEGTKSLAFELCDQLDYNIPDWIFCPTGSGGLISGIFRGFKEFEKLDFIKSVPKMVAVQSEQCSPIVESFNKRSNPLDFKDWSFTPKTIANGLADPHPWDADSALETLYESQGEAVSVGEEDIIRTHSECAKYEGIFGEPTGTAALAGLEQLAYDGTVDPSDVVIIPITGTGFKDINCILNNIQLREPINPSIDELKRIL